MIAVNAKFGNGACNVLNSLGKPCPLRHQVPEASAKKKKKKKPGWRVRMTRLLWDMFGLEKTCDLTCTDPVVVIL